MSTFSTKQSNAAMLAMLDYLKEEAEQAQSIEDIKSIFRILEQSLCQSSIVNRVSGLDHIRAETSSSRHNVATTVPDELISTFYDLSERMNQLQVEDPETYKNASCALHWLANNDKNIN